MSAVVVAIGTAVAGVAMAGASIYGANKQAAAARNAQNIAQAQYKDSKALAAPYTGAGSAAQNQLNYLLGTNGDTTGANTSLGGQGSLMSPFTADMMKQYSPAYQFQLQQGQQGVLNGGAASQGALSGAALTGITNYNQAAANTAFSSANSIYQQQQQNIYQRLADTANRGQAAAAGTAQNGTALAGQAAQSATNQGIAAANGATGVANAIGSTASSLGGIYAAYGGGGGQGMGAGVSPSGYQTQGGYMMTSDRRLKKNIRRIGTTKSGQPWYEFEYTFAPGVRTGVMADESPPYAVAYDAAGYAMVDYSRIS